MRYSGNRYTDKDLRDNYEKVKAICGFVPLYNDFKLHTDISLNTYAARFNLKGKVFDKVNEYYSTVNEYNDYLIRKNNHKTSVGKMTGKMSAIFTDDNYETNLRYIFDTYMLKYSSYPSRRLFDSISPLNSRNYRKKYNKSWSKICESYGFIIGNKNKEESICIGMCAEIFKCKFESGKTWNWLIGVGGKNMFCDGYFDSLKLNIEFDGISHRVAISKYGGEERLIRTKENDKLKDTLLKEHGIKTIRIDSRLKWYTLDKLIKILICECKSRGYDYHDFFILPEEKSA